MLLFRTIPDAVIISIQSTINVLCFSWSFIRYLIGCLNLLRASQEAREMLLRAAQFQILLIVILIVILQIVILLMIRNVASCVSHDLQVCVLPRYKHPPSTSYTTRMLPVATRPDPSAYSVHPCHCQCDCDVKTRHFRTIERRTT
jgi:hypothetical protein